MAGNEKEIAKFLVKRIDKITLPHLKAIESIGAPTASADKYIGMYTEKDVDNLLATEASGKKADFYINGYGISYKQRGSSNLFNRAQRAELVNIFLLLGFSKPDEILLQFDNEVARFHNGEIKRDCPWQNFFSEKQFKLMLKFLMMDGSPNLGKSTHPAEFILEAPSKNIQQNNISVFTFDEYFEVYKNDIKIGLRRVWYGQESKSEHSRACGLLKKEGNKPWIFNTISGSPRKHPKTKKIWRDEIPVGERKTVYFFMILK